MEVDAGLTAVTHIAELGRQILADQLAIIQIHQLDLSQDTSVTAVHETRKAIRRTFTAVKLFYPYFEPGLLPSYRRQLRKVMKQLGPCRDTAVFLDKLHDHTTDSPIPLNALESYWQGQLAAANANLRLYLEQPQWTPFWAEYAAFTAAPNAGRLPTKSGGLLRARYVIPVLLYQRVADVLAYNAYVTSAERLSVKKLHQLRIQCKELRYAFQFFVPFLGSEIEPAIEALKLLQVNLGDLNDARVALEMLARAPERETLALSVVEVSVVEAAVAHYQDVQKATISRLLDEFHPLWAELNAPEWRQNLAAAVAKL